MIGAVKTNIGHSEAASGLSALIKAILTVEKGVIPPTRGVVKKNPKIDWENWKVDVVRDATPFPAHLPVKRVSVNSFGYGGTNAHMIIESAESFLPDGSPYTDSSKSARRPRDAFSRNRPFLLPFAAHDKATLEANINAHSKVASKYNLLDLSYTLANRRTRLASRGFAIASHANLESTLESLKSFSFADKKKTPTLGFVFTGQGAQWARMGNELMSYYPSFLRSIRMMDNALEELPDGPEWTIEDTLLEDAATSRVNEAEFSQPLCTAIQVALVQLLALWGIKPVVTAGHSSGEIGAAYAAGLVTATEAIAAAYYRGKVVRDVNTNGAMMAVGLGAEAVAPYLSDVEGKVVIACHNSPLGVTLSGDADALETVKAKLDAESIFARPVKTGGKAYHSHHMRPVAATYEQLFSNGRKHLPPDSPLLTSAKMVSSVTNTVIPEDAIVDEKYWSANLRSPVLFNQAIQTIATNPEFSKVDMLIEIGPHSALSGPVKQVKAEYKFEKLNYLPTLLRGENCANQLLKLAGELFLRDYPLDMERVTSIEDALPSGKIRIKKGSMLVDLPTYQWRYNKDLWAEVRHSREHRAPTHARHDILGARLPGTGDMLWRNVFRMKDLPWLKSHSLGGEAVFPAAGYFSMAMEAITQINEISSSPVPIESYVLRDVSIKTALVTPDDDDGIEVIFTMRPSIHSENYAKTQWWEFGCSSISMDGQRKDHISGSIGINARDRGQKSRQVPNLPQRASGKSWNQALRQVGFDYGPTFQDMDNIATDGVNYVAASDTQVRQECGIMQGESRHILHPGIVDSCLQLIIVSIYAGRINEMKCGAIPIQVDEVAIFPPTEEQLQEKSARAFSWTDQRGIRSLVSSSELVAKDGEVLMEITDMRTTYYEAAVPQGAELAIESQPYQEMAWKLDIDTIQANEITNSLDVASLVELSYHKKPSLKALEIGSANMAAALSKANSIDYTGTGPSDEAVAEVHGLTDGYRNAHALKLDITEPLDGQGIAAGSYDLVVAPTELMNSPPILETVRKLLKAGGRVIWDLKGKSDSTLLRDAQLTAFDLLLKQGGKPSAAISTAFESTVNGHHVNGVSKNVRLVYRQKQTEALAKIKSAFENLGWDVVSSALEGTGSVEGEQVVLLTDFEGPLLAAISESEFAAVQNITNNASSLLWVTPGGLLEGKRPEYAMAAGLVRSISSEQASIKITTLDFDLDNTAPQAVGDIVAQVAEKVESSDREREYYVSNGLLYISRIAPNTQVNTVYSANIEAQPTPYDSKAHLIGKVESGKVVFETDTRTEEPLDEDQVEVKVTASGLSKEDTLVINGTDYPTTFSHEMGGVVSKVGSKVVDFSVGDYVAGFSFDKFATFQRVPATLVQKLEGSDSVNNVVSLLMSYGAALYGLKNLARLEAGETLLVLEGTGFAGAAAVKLAQVLQANVFVAVNSDNEVSTLKTVYGLSDEQILHAGKASIASQLKAATGKSGADVVFSSSSAVPDIAREAWRTIAPLGRFVDSGRKNVLKRSTTDTVPLHHGASYLSFDILDLYKYKPAALAEILRLIVSFYRQRSIAPLKPLTVKNIAELDSAVASFSDTFSSGKTVLVYEPSETPLNVIPSRPALKFSPDATYLLVGCLGGLGRSLTSWMMKHGARRFTFLSRSGADAQQAAHLVKDIEAAGAIVQVVRGDATVRKDVDRAIAGVPAQNPVKGVVQAAMVLRDGIFAQMSYANWKTSTNPKVTGTRNLHEALASQDLDFFLMTSSVSGTLGTPGQANYAAANAYLDSLARHRRSLGSVATSAILPMVLGVGVVAENFEIEESLKSKGMYGIEEDSLLELFEAAITVQGQRDSADHVVGGMDPSKLQKAINDSGATDIFWQEDSRFSTMVATMKSGQQGAGAGSAESILSVMKSMPSPAEAVSAIATHFTEKLSRMLLIDLDEFELEGKSVGDYGLDSMIGASLRNWIFKEYAIDIPFQQLVAPSLTIGKFAKQVCAKHDIVVE